MVIKFEQALDAPAALAVVPEDTSVSEPTVTATVVTPSAGSVWVGLRLKSSVI